MTTETRPGFRLPWTGSSTSQDPSAAGDEAVAEEAQEPTMIETAAMPAPDAPTEPPAEPDPTQPKARRATKFMAELSRAMQAAAENARGETMARFEVEAKGVVETVHASATDEAANLRRKADDDVAAIREWSKAEIARIREETESRIAARKVGLDNEMEQHAASVDARVERVKAVVAAFEVQMAAFFERLNAEEDPTRIATMAETMPDPPSLADVAASIGAAPPAGSGGAPAPERTEGVPTATADGETDQAAAFDFEAAEAEAASFTGELDAEDSAADAASEADASVAAETTPALDLEPTPAADLASTRVVVSGLVSVANIANFKRSLARITGVSTIAVASGPDGAFVFTVGHTLGTGLAASVQGLAGFDVQITSESDGAINVAALDRDATD